MLLTAVQRITKTVSTSLQNKTAMSGQSNELHVYLKWLPGEKKPQTLKIGQDCDESWVRVG